MVPPRLRRASEEGEPQRGDNRRMAERLSGPAISELDTSSLTAFVDEWLALLSEDEVLAVLENPYCTAAICGRIARAPRLSAWYSVRLRLVRHRAVAQHDAMRFVPFLFWPDLLRISTDVRIPPAVRRAAEMRLGAALEKMSAGERISAAKTCSRETLRVLLFDEDSRVFAGLLINPRMTEDDLLRVASSDRATPENLALIADHPKWSSRYALRLALAANPRTPKAVAASQLRFLRRADLAALATNPVTSLYLRRCIERLAGR
jgi:hypothetical protein